MPNRSPETHPPPPVDLGRISLPRRTLDHPWYRCHSIQHSAIFFGRMGDSRFDAPGEEFGILYLAESREGAFVETFLRRPALQRFLTEKHLHERRMAEVTFSRSLDLVDPEGAGLSKVGADARLSSGGDYRLAQRWSLAFWCHPDQPDGILYRSRHNPRVLCAAIYDRVEVSGDEVRAEDLGSITGEPDLGVWIERYGIRFLG